MTAEVRHKDQHGVTHYYCGHHAPQPAAHDVGMQGHGEQHGQHAVPTGAGGHGGTDQHANHQGHDKHAGHSVNMFRDKFWVSLALTIPVIAYSSMIQQWLGFTAPTFPWQ